MQVFIISYPKCSNLCDVLSALINWGPLCSDSRFKVVVSNVFNIFRIVKDFEWRVGNVVASLFYHFSFR